MQGWRQGAVGASQWSRAQSQRGCPPGCGRGRSRGAGVAPAELTRFWVDQDPGLTARVVQAGGATNARIDRG